MPSARSIWVIMQVCPCKTFHPAVSAWFEATFTAPTAGAEPGLAGDPRAAPHPDRCTHRLRQDPGRLSRRHRCAGAGGAGAAGSAKRTHVLYVSPLKALSNDIQKNLQQPLLGIRDELQALGLPDVPISALVRTGDTPARERERMRREPPHILVTTPESLYLLLTADSGRAMLASVGTVIVDEIHALAGSKRGSHLMLSLERLAALCPQAAGAHRPVGHAKTDRGDGALSDRRGAGLHDHRHRPCAPPGSGPRAARLAAGSGAWPTRSGRRSTTAWRS